MGSLDSCLISVSGWRLTLKLSQTLKCEKMSGFGPAAINRRFVEVLD